MYLLTAVADLVHISQNGSDISTKYMPVLERLWGNMVEKKMYVTGGIGAIKQWEGFGIDYFLPQGTDEGGCYAETCAAIGVMMLAERLLQVFSPIPVPIPCPRIYLSNHPVYSPISIPNTRISWNSACIIPF